MPSQCLKYSAVFDSISLIFLLLIPRDPKNALFLGFSTSRLIMLVGFFLGLLVLVTAVLWLKGHPDVDQRLAEALQQVAGHGWLRELVLSLAALVILAGPIHLSVYLFTTDLFIKSNLLRLLPITLFVSGTSWEVLHLDAFRESGKRWVTVIGLTALGTAAGWLFQRFLLGLVLRPTTVDPSFITASQVGLGLTVFFWAVHFLNHPRKERPTLVLLLLLVALLALIQWEMYPHKYWRALRLIALFTPLSIFAITIIAQLILSLWDRLRQKQRIFVQIGVVVALLILVVPYYIVTTIHSRTLNFPPVVSDQTEYVKFAKTARMLNFLYTGDHNRMPLYPFLQGFFYQPGMSDEEFSDQSLQRNILLSLVLLALIYLVFRRHLGALLGALLTGIVAFSLYIFKAPYIQVEILYYFLAFMGFILVQYMLVHPTIKLGMAAGIICGLAYLAKASVLPGLIFFGALFTLKELVQIVQIRMTGKLDWEGLLPVLRRLSAGGAVFVLFIVVIFPYINAMKQQFGQYFYNVNTSVYIWFDSNDQAIQAESQYHFTERWPSELSPEELPSLRNYLRHHTLAQILDRIRSGLQEQINNILSPFSVSNFHLSYLVILALTFLLNLRYNLALMKRHLYLVGFNLLYFFGYLAAFVWYSPIAPERRFIYGLYIPLMFAVFFALKTLTSNQQNSGSYGWGIDTKRFVNLAHVVMFLFLAANIWLVLTERMFYDRFGA
jgi:hypothetical protein